MLTAPFGNSSVIPAKAGIQNLRSQSPLIEIVS
jgi:hypothetical protein